MRDYLIFASGAFIGTTVTLVSVYISNQQHKRSKAQARQEHLARAQELLEEETTELCILEN